MTKTLIAGLFAAMLALNFGATDAFAKGSSHASSSSSTHSVRSHVTKKGTYVAPHGQTNPNATKKDNWSTKGNVNPVTGKPGTKSAVK
ncbi:MAG: hypothetical protein CK529_13450 [Rhodospirillaceae bacterium]|nr:MAG: hypothetical protein CK529_13450 [Rhodospirillaceae bacterium]